MMRPFVAHLQTISIPKKDALRVLAAADSNKVAKQHIALLVKDTSLLASRIREIQGGIGALKATIESYKKDSVNYERIISLKDKSIKLAEDETAAWKKEYKKEKRKRFWTGVSGAVLTGAVILIRSR